jgi:hypothetical protein
LKSRLYQSLFYLLPVKVSNISGALTEGLDLTNDFTKLQFFRDISTGGHLQYLQEVSMSFNWRKSIVRCLHYQALLFILTLFLQW